MSFRFFKNNFGRRNNLNVEEENFLKILFAFFISCIIIIVTAF